eukprot:5522560-Pleurochrysis_carterae.AAC.2
MCHVHPLSTTKLKLVTPDASRRPCRGERRWRVARSARAFVEGGREIEGLRGTFALVVRADWSSGKGPVGSDGGSGGMHAAWLFGE